tara:strand:- start:1670 stop:1945 length:276 start_codon:yes stop_codon:yes gene_type:complete
MEYKKEFVLVEILYFFTKNIRIKKSIKLLTKYTYEQTKNDKLMNHFNFKLLEKNFNKMKAHTNYQKKNRLKITNSFVKRRRITEDTPLLIF